MAAIVSPKPRTASRTLSTTSSRRVFSPPIYMADEFTAQPRGPRSPVPLLSPLELVDSGTRKRYITKSPTPCSPTKRRRGVAHPASRAPRRRHCPRGDCMMSSLGGSAFFDHLPWTLGLDSEPELLSVWDIADLSLLPVEYPASSVSPSTGPVRSRKTSLRSNPLAIDSQSTCEVSPTTPRSAPFPDSSVFALYASRGLPSDPRTPPPREPFVPNEIIFHGLNPILPLHGDAMWMSPLSR